MLSFASVRPVHLRVYNSGLDSKRSVPLTHVGRAEAGWTRSGLFRPLSLSVINVTFQNSQFQSLEGWLVLQLKFPIKKLELIFSDLEMDKALNGDV